VGDFEAPLHVASDPDDPDRLFVVETEGEIELVTPTSTSTYLDIENLVLAGGERGLFSVAFPADHAQSRLLYVAYSGNDGDVFIDEYRASGDSVDPATRREVLRLEHSSAGNHNGGQLHFGPDGYLYLATGDSGASSDPAQDLTSLHGKILRIDPRQAGDAPYSVPPDNPFAGTAADPVAGSRDEIWSYGLRNPWRWSFDRLTGALTIGDVGAGSWEEVDYVSTEAGRGRGTNFGWDCREGAHDHQTDGCEGEVFTDPIFEYSGAVGPAAITGGYVSRDPGVSELYGRYLYADFFDGDLRSLAPEAAPAVDDRDEGLDVANPTSFGQDACGRVFVASQGGAVVRIAGAAPTACATHALGVALAGDGSGRVTGPGFDCPGDCTETAFAGERAELAAAPAPDSVFLGWSDACTGAGTCALVADADKTATATFDRKDATKLKLKPRKRRVRRGKRAHLTVEATPCPGRAGDEVSFLRRGAVVRTKTLSGSCRARSRPRIRRKTPFGAEIAADELHLGAKAKPKRIKVRRPKRGR
jgi:hypothetical protein